MSPLAAIQSLLCAYLKGELPVFVGAIAGGRVTTYTAVALLGNGLLAFFLNISSFQTNKLAGALTISVCGNVKQCLTILVGIVLFDVKVGLLNGLGMFIALAGAAWYSKVELDSKGKGKGVEQHFAPQHERKGSLHPTSELSPNSAAEEWDEKQVISKRTDL